MIRYCVKITVVCSYNLLSPTCLLSGINLHCLVGCCSSCQGYSNDPATHPAFHHLCPPYYTGVATIGIIERPRTDCQLFVKQARLRFSPAMGKPKEARPIGAKGRPKSTFKERKTAKALVSTMGPRLELTLDVCTCLWPFSCRTAKISGGMCLMRWQDLPRSPPTRFCTSTTTLHVYFYGCVILVLLNLSSPPGHRFIPICLQCRSIFFPHVHLTQHTPSSSHIAAISSISHSPLLPSTSHPPFCRSSHS